MKSDEAMLLFALFFIGLPLGLWFYQDNIYAFFQMVDGILLKGFSFIPIVGDYYGNVSRAYEELSPQQLTWQHIWIAGQIAWRPISVLVFFPMLLRWAWKARKVRRAQAFNDINKAYILKHCGTKQTAPDNDARQQWVVRRWYQFYGLHRLQWGSADWNLRLRRALSLQLGKPSGSPESQDLLTSFATFMYGQVVLSFGDKMAQNLPVKTMVDEATKNHAYLGTAMVRVLAATRDQFGVVSPQGFRNALFLKSETVPIWFALNGLTRQTTHAESLGVLSHFYVEVSEGGPIQEPQLDGAIDGLEMYRTHLIEQRKLKDLDESKAYAEQERKAKVREDAEKAERGGGSPDSGYSENEQILT